MPEYNKLVRDLVPQIIEKSGKNYETKILDDEDYITALGAKLGEEVEEYFAAENDQDRLEELADVLEVIHTLAYKDGTTMEEVEKIRQQKAEKRGGFKDKIFLVEVEDES
ncbi:nucleoside triphosphate pyrophosphohydrolase [Gracilibacillus sp. YIM 98692]|uniref:nucleoside triphosphate pyrophosphohydrolase n=1 Tax=Gracilibacillus sp. YIM 98692 TaxID=2663532 RepID=UPI0013D6D143|nr:nucleoside triphosphate pyrophosphohydrolase [Gracilibacillus sp. YIM 98692]